MSLPKPEFHLRRVDADGSQGPLEIVPLCRLPDGTHLARRGFLGTGLTAASALGLMGGCGDSSPRGPARPVAPPPGASIPVAATPPEQTKPAEPATTSPATVIFAHSEEITGLAVSPDGTMLVSCARDRTVKLWSLPEGRHLKTLDSQVVYGLRREIMALAISADGSLLASGSGDGESTICLWALPEGKLLRTLKGHSRELDQLEFTPDGAQLLSRDSDAKVKLWSVGDGELQHTWSNIFSQYRLTPDGKTLAVLRAAQANNWVGASIELWSLPQPRLERTIEVKELPIHATLAVVEGGVSLVCSAGEKQSLIWSIPSGDLQRKVGASILGSGFATTPNGLILASFSAPVRLAGVKEREDTSIYLYGMPSGNQIHSPLKGHTLPVTVLAVSRDGTVLASGAEDTTVRLWSLPEAEPLATLVGPMHPMGAYKGLVPSNESDAQALEERRKQLAGGGKDGIGHIRKLAFTPDGNSLAVGDNMGMIVLWDLPTATPRSVLFDPEASSTSASSYEVVDAQTGRTVTYTFPCGSPVPAGATCVCNCVPGTYRDRGVVTRFYGGGSICTCNSVCTCVPVYRRR